MNWEILRELSQKWYGRIGRFFLFQNFVLYLFACVTGRGLFGPAAYIHFLNHCCAWAGH
jgi:hypothetical protein